MVKPLSWSCSRARRTDDRLSAMRCDFFGRSSCCGQSLHHGLPSLGNRRHAHCEQATRPATPCPVPTLVIRVAKGGGDRHGDRGAEQVRSAKRREAAKA